MEAHDATFIDIQAQSHDLSNVFEVLQAEHAFTLNMLFCMISFVNKKQYLSVKPN